MKNQGFIKKLLSAVLVLAFLAAPALDSLECANCQEGHKATLPANNQIQPPQAPSPNINNVNNGQKGSEAGDPRDCPFCFLNVFGLISAPPNQTLSPAISFQTPAAAIFLSHDLSPKINPPRA
jgi:hypothetical protein